MLALEQALHDDETTRDADDTWPRRSRHRSRQQSVAAMSPRAMMLVTLAAALGSGMIGGAFFAFSSFVMRALGRLAPPDAIRAMQSINVVVINPLFLGVFVGTALVCAVLAFLSIASWSDAGSGLRLAGCLLYLIGTFAVTMLCNVPRNNALAAQSADTADGATCWTRYLREWTRWNHLRTLAALAASALLVAAQLAVVRGAP